MLYVLQLRPLIVEFIMSVIIEIQDKPLRLFTLGPIIPQFVIMERGMDL